MTSDGDQEHEAGPQLGLAESASWEDVGRHAVRGELFDAREDVADAFRQLEETLWTGEPIDEDEVREARVALNRARRVIEQYVATVADGTEPWEQPLPDVPYGRLWEVTGHEEA